MRITKEIPVASVIMDHSPITPDTNSLIKHLESGGYIPPIHVAKLEHGMYRICDGWHRMIASKMLGRETIKARFSTKVMKGFFNGYETECLRRS